MKKPFAIIALLMMGLITHPLFAKKNTFTKEMEKVVAPEKKQVNNVIHSVENPESDMPDDWKK